MSRTRFLLMTSLAGGMAIACAAGCAARGEMAIPSTAQVLASGNGRLEATPTREGTVYVYDATDNRIIYSGTIHGGDRVIVDPNNNLVTVNGNTVTEPHLHGDHQYKIEFDHP